MKLLLDTHILIWSYLVPEKIAPRVGEALERTDNELWFSPVSTWEIVLLLEKKRLGVSSKEDPFKWADRVVEGLREAPLNKHVAAMSRRLAFTHDDPADRFIAATAQVYGLTLVTNDARLLELQDVQVLR